MLRATLGAGNFHADVEAIFHTKVGKRKTAPTDALKPDPDGPRTPSFNRICLSRLCARPRPILQCHDIHVEFPLSSPTIDPRIFDLLGTAFGATAVQDAVEALDELATLAEVSGEEDMPSKVAAAFITFYTLAPQFLRARAVQEYDRLARRMGYNSYVDMINRIEIDFDLLHEMGVDTVTVGSAGVK